MVLGGTLMLWAKHAAGAGAGYGARRFLGEFAVACTVEKSCAMTLIGCRSCFFLGDDINIINP